MTSVVPNRYRDRFVAVQVAVPGGRVVMTAAGPRADVSWRWKCNHCSKFIRPNTAGAQSHIAKHVREVEARKRQS